MKDKVKNQKGFIQISLLVAIIIASISVASVGTGVVLYKQQKTPSFTANVSEIFYKTIYEKKFEIEKLKHEAELSKIKEERAEKHAQEEIVKRTEAEQIAKEETTKRAKEEIARKEAEQIAQEETIKRSQAEAKAAQEEYEKKLKEQELDEKEAEEKKMSADNDGDGLTYREESAKGTSDWDTDSDGDGISDGEDTNPTGEGGNMTQVFNWSYGGYNYKTEAAIHDDWFNYYKAKQPRPNVRSVEYVTYNDPFIKSISNEISRVATKENNPCGACFATAFVHSISYIDDKYTGYDEFPRYPVETIMQKTGDCEDTSYLTASIIQAMNIGTVLILLPGHMAVGVWMDCDSSGTYYKLGDRCYYYIETTNAKDWSVGEMPPDAPRIPATLIKIPSGEMVDNVSPQYKKPCNPSPDFSGYYYDGSNYYSDSQCNNLTYCLLYEEYYIKPKELDFYWDSNCTQIVVAGCSKSTSYPGYFTNGIDYYSDSRCISKARFCRPSPNYSDTYYDGYNEYWDSNCTQKVVSWCSKSIYYPGYFFSSLDYEYYYDSQCTQKADL